MPRPVYPSGKPNGTWTFGQLRDWANARSPGAGDQFITWVETHNNVPPPYAVDLNSRTFGPGGLGSNNTALDWFGAWLLFGQLEPRLGKILAGGITSGSKLIPKALQGTAEGIGKVPGAGILSNPLSALGDFLTQRSLWIRIVEGVLGTGLIIVAASKLGGNSSIGRAATKAGKAVKIL